MTPSTTHLNKETAVHRREQHPSLTNELQWETKSKSNAMSTPKPYGPQRKFAARLFSSAVNFSSSHLIFHHHIFYHHI